MRARIPGRRDRARAGQRTGRERSVRPGTARCAIFLAIIVLPESPGRDEDDVAGALEEVERGDRFDQGAVDGRGPVPVEVGEGLELLEARARARSDVPNRDGRDPSLRGSATCSRTSAAPHRFLGGEATRSSIAALAAKIECAKASA